MTARVSNFSSLSGTGFTGSSGGSWGTSTYTAAFPGARYSQFAGNPRSQEKVKMKELNKVLFLNQAKNHLKILLKEKIPIFLWGPPGIGKSSIVKQICEEWKWDLIDLRLSLLNPVDLRGLPYFNKERQEAVWLRPEFLPTKGKGILFLDELNTAPVSVQIAAYQLLLDRRIGSYIFPDDWRIVAAGNRETDLAAVTKMPSPLANRLIHLNVEANIDDWKIWAQGKVDSRIIAFLNFRPNLLSTLPKEEEKAYSTPRSWAFVSRILSLYPSLDEAEPIIDGTIGVGASKEFFAFLAIYKDLPDIDGILQGKITNVPTKADVLYALSSALVVKLKIEYIDNFLAYTLKMPPEFATLVARDAARSGWDKKMQESPYWRKWADKFGEYL